MFFDPTITQVLRDALPWAGTFFKLMSELGGELAYIAIILTGYWAFKKRESLIAAMVLLVAIISNYWLKMAIANPRPDPTYWLEGVDATHYSTPSGHAQYSATIFGWFAVKVRTWWMFLISLVMTTLIGISRIYLGVHYLGDVLLGWGIGAFTVAVLYYFREPITDLIMRIKVGPACGILFLVGFVLTLISWFLPYPPETNFGNVGGLTMGLAIGIPLEQRFVSFSTEPPNGQKWRLVLRVVLGLALVILVLGLLEPILVSELLWWRTARYAIVTIIGVFVWPAMFKKLRI